MHGVAQGASILHLADKQEVDYGTLLKHQHQIQKLALKHKPDPSLANEATKRDEMFQNIQKKGTKPDPDDPPK